MEPRDELGMTSLRSTISVTVRTLERESFDVYAPADERVDDFKARVARSCVALRPSWRQTLVHCGEVLADEQTLGRAGVGDGAFVVCCLRRADSTSPCAPRRLMRSAAPKPPAPPAPQTSR